MEKEGLERVAIMVGPRGRGSNMAALIEACRRGDVPATVEVVIPSAVGSDAEANAAGLVVKTEVVRPGDDSLDVSLV